MDFSWSREEDEFRQEIRDFLKAELPAVGMTRWCWTKSPRSTSARQRLYAKGRCEGLAGGTLAARVRRSGLVLLAVLHHE